MGDDGRTYIRVHDGMPDHPKVETLSDRAFRLLVETWCWSSRHLTDGQVPKGIWQRRGTPRARRELIDAGLVEDLGTEVQMHDYLEHQRSRADVAEIVAARKAASIKANHTRWHTGPKGKPDTDCPLCNGSESDPKGHPKSDPATDSDSGSAGVSGSIPIDRGIDRDRDTAPPEETLGGGVPDRTARVDDAPPPEPLRDPTNPRCAQHRDIPATDRGPNCRACAAVRREVEALPPVDAAAAERAARRDLIDRCPDCDETGMRDLGDVGVGRCTHPLLLEESRS